MKNGLIMEGGAMRGLFTAGVLDIMMENNIVPDGCVGVSAGAAFGCNIKSHQIGRVIRYNLRFAKDWRFASVWSWFITGDLYGGEFDYQVLPKKLDYWDIETFAKNPMEFYVVATNAKNGKALYHKCFDGGQRDLLWIQGSASMPIASKPVQVDGFTLLDGGISDSIPLTFFNGIGYEHNLVILTQPRTYTKQQYSEKQLKFLQRALRKTPAIYNMLAKRYLAYNEELEEIWRQEQEGKILVIRPRENLKIGSISHDVDEEKRVYEAGREAGMDYLDAMKRFYGEDNNLPSTK